MRLARAKVNLWLKVVGRRADGYHLLDSLIAFTDLADTLEVGPSDGLSLALEGPEAAGLAGEADNLVLRAARLLADRAGVSPRAALSLAKHIPVAAGLGGGSADAAAALHALVDLWRVALPVEELFDLAAALGADVPMCLAGRPALVSGVGEVLRPAPPLPPCAILLVNPRTLLATPAVFAARRGPFSMATPVPSSWPDLGGLVAALAARGNDLADAAISLRPAIADVLAALGRTEGVRYAEMSGSGATCFALYDDVDAAGRAAAGLPDRWWRHAGRLISD
ncbi:MAG: 4-(cytidine 5'-diphospho)-2-C-methyl-D-erythritol kinase [Reyranella sp.]|nr:4-(cytidine 5'-diphospho)-2-C-methyl-D-erythritol kinase [Reyranella sp.]